MNGLTAKELEMLEQQQNQKNGNGNGSNKAPAEAKRPNPPKTTVAGPEAPAEEGSKGNDLMVEAQRKNKEALGIQVTDLAVGIQTAAKEASVLADQEAKTFVSTYAQKNLKNRQGISTVLTKLRTTKAELYSALAPAVEVEGVENDEDFLSVCADFDTAGLIPGSADSLPGSSLPDSSQESQAPS